MLNEWIDWDGGECPVPPDTLVDIRIREGYEAIGEDVAGGWNWKHHMLRNDIVAYKIHHPNAGAELFRLRAEVASLGHDLGMARIVVEQKQARLESAEAHIADLTQQLAAANGRVEQFAWATFDGEGSYDLRLYQDNENYRDEYIRINGNRYASWVIPLYSALSDLPDADKEKTK